MSVRRARLQGWLVATAAVIVASGCALNASLEVEMELPYAPAPRARVEVCHADCDFDVWDAFVFDLEPDLAECETGGSCNVRFSVLTEQAELERLFVRVRFCDDDCYLDVARPDAPGLWFELEQPFQRGGRTYWNPSAEPFVRVPDTQPPGRPTDVIQVSRCEIRDQCWAPSTAVPDPTIGYCNAAGERFCDAGGVRRSP